MSLIVNINIISNNAPDDNTTISELGDGTRGIDGGAPRAYAQWISMQIKNLLGNASIKIQNADAKWGKFYKDGNKGDELSSGTINGIVIAPNFTSTVAACGRSSASSGTEGTIDLYDGTVRICTLYWNCPWGKKSNKFEKRNVNSNYLVTIGSWNSDSGAIGNVNIDVERY
ncbi:uncharacterized protein FIBRA_06728 [Fibroporia radiculosa]|uniref:Uncharacterized protein n=1 Tax=Fibroporia radiculosa TaxID=599839 RepID=J4HZK1_9APHY|nr:uncharacterized protein FIBRA_06728 [Fibroporia radiculosa]CCM04547.1 predicted protein [Fibroporia radiculosa]